MGRALKDVAVPLFCTACNECPTDRFCKLDKLRNLWTANQYFDEAVIAQLNDPVQSAANYQAKLMAENQDVRLLWKYGSKKSMITIILINTPTYVLFSYFSLSLSIK